MNRPFAAFLLALLVPLAAPAAPEDFPRPPELEPAIRFWTKVYTQVSTDGGLIHDRDNLSIVYEKMQFDDGLSRRERSRQVRERKAYYRQALLEAAASDREHLSRGAAKVLSLWPNGVSDSRLQRAAYNIRFQLGQSDKFRAGLVRSGAWEPHIRRTLERGDSRRLQAGNTDGVEAGHINIRRRHRLDRDEPARRVAWRHRETAGLKRADDAQGNLAIGGYTVGRRIEREEFA